MLDLAVSLWLGALLVTSALLAVVVLAQGTARQVRRLVGHWRTGPLGARTEVAQPPSSRRPVRTRERLPA